MGHVLQSFPWSADPPLPAQLPPDPLLPALLPQDLIKQFFRHSIDDLKRERALFEGPPPLLLASMNVEDLCILLSGSDHNTSQVRGQCRDYESSLE